MAVAYKSIEFRLHEYLVQIQDMLTLLEADEKLLTKINDNKELIKTKKYRVAVMGEFKRGKSSLINALLGHKILPADVEPATATINRITYGTQLKAVVEFKDGTNREVNVSELADYVTKLTPTGASRAASIKEAIVYTPTVICQNYVDIIDTPGLNDNEEMTKITIDMLNNVDAVVVAIHARFPFGETEKDFVSQLIKSENINNIVFVVTFLDTLDEDDYVYDDFMTFIKNRIQTEVTSKLNKDNEPQEIIDKAHMLLDDLHIYGISSSLALKYFVTNDRKAFEKSRFDVFKVELMQIVTAKQVENAVHNAVADIKTVLSSLEEQYNLRMQRYVEDELTTTEHAKCINDFCLISGGKLSALFTDRYQEIDKLINSLNCYKNILVSAFIKALSSLRSNVHSDIESAIAFVSFEQYKQMNETHLPSLKNELLLLLEHINWGFGNDRQNVLTQHMHALNIANGFDLQKTMADVHAFTETVLADIRFSWAVSAIPNVPNLSECNVIEYIIEAVDTSIKKLIENVNTAVDKSREFVFKSVNHDNEVIISMTKQAEIELRNTIDVRSKGYTSNYTIFAQTAKDIVNNSELILQEVNSK